MLVTNLLPSFCSKTLDDAFGKVNSIFFWPDDASGQSPQERLRSFIDTEMKKREKGKRQEKLMFARNLRSMVLLVLKNDGINVSEYDEPGSIPAQEYRKFRLGFVKVLPTFWETIVLNMFGDNKVMHFGS